MPCSGPSRNPKRAEAIYQDILTLLKEKYHIFEFEYRFEKDKIADLLNTGMSRARNEVLQQLKDVCHEIEWQHQCENF